MRPMEFLLDAYLPEHYKNSIGSTRGQVFGKIWGLYQYRKTFVLCDWQNHRMIHDF